MKKKIKNILKDESGPIKSFGKLDLSENHLILINNLLKKKKYSKVHFINWTNKNKILVDESEQLKTEIYQQLVANMLRDTNLAIDLTNCEIDEDFLKCLANELKTNRHIGAIFLSQHDEHQFETSDSIHRISKYIRRNNRDFRRFPSDYIHCLLATHCFSNKDESIEKKMNDLGWKIEEELPLFTDDNEDQKDDKAQMYLSKLYKNESTRQLVLAFRGIKLKVRDWFRKDTELESVIYGTLANEVTSYSYYAYQHCKLAYETSKKLGYNLSFTGYSFGAWLAEQSVYFCYKNYETRNLRAVTFDSPGSFDIIQELAKTHIHNCKKEDVDKFLDIKTFLFSPNFMNTSNEHVGKVYRVFEKSLLKGDVDSVEIWDDFITNKFISKIPSDSLRKLFEKWYEKIVKANLLVKQFGIKTVKKIAPKYLFYLNGIRAMFSDDINWLLDEFENNENFEIELREVKRWPKMDFRPKSENFGEFNLAESALAITPFVKDFIPERLRSIVSMPIDAVLNRIIKGAVSHCFSSLAVIYNIIAEIATGGLKDEQCLLCFENDRVILNDEPVLGKEAFDLVFGGSYEVKTIDPYKEKLYLLDSTHLDNQIKSYFSDRNKLGNHKLEDQFRKLESTFNINVEVDGEYEVYYLQSAYKNVSVEVIRERFWRLYEINKIYERRYSKKSTQSLCENHYFLSMRNSNFVKEDEKIFEKIDVILKKSQYCCIYGKSGYGKTTLAYEYGYYIKDYSNQYFVHSIVSGDEMTNLNELASRFLSSITLNKSEKPKPEELVKLIRNKIDFVSKGEFCSYLII